MRIAFALASAAALMTFSACATPEPELALDIEAAPRSVRATEAVTLSATLVNVSSTVQSVSNPATAPCSGYPFAVVDSRGRRVRLRTGLCLAVVFPPLELQPGESAEYSLAWTPAATSLENSTTPLGPGRYRVIGDVRTNVLVRSNAEVVVVP